jgi:hypothetical protein
MFYNTPITNSSYFSGLYGSIFVKQSLLSQWKTASYWSEYTDRFVGLTDEEIEALDNGSGGSYVDENNVISLNENTTVTNHIIELDNNTVVTNHILELDNILECENISVNNNMIEFGNNTTITSNMMELNNVSVNNNILEL